jgi:hypothetical protein
LAFSRNENLDLIIDELVIIENARHIYTEEYIELTKEFFENVIPKIRLTIIPLLTLHSYQTYSLSAVI